MKLKSESVALKPQGKIKANKNNPQNKHRKQRKQKASQNEMMKGRTKYYLDIFELQYFSKQQKLRS